MDPDANFFPCGARSVLSPIRSPPFPALLLLIAAAPGKASSASLLQHRVLPSGRWRVGKGVSARWSQSRSVADGGRGGPVLAMESLATSIGCGRRRVEGRGVLVANDGAYMARRKVRIARGTGKTRMIGLLPSRPQLGNYVKFALSFAKLPKMQTPNAKLLDTSFCDFWQITRMQTPNTKMLEML